MKNSEFSELFRTLRQSCLSCPCSGHAAQGTDTETWLFSGCSACNKSCSLGLHALSRSGRAPSTLKLFLACGQRKKVWYELTTLCNTPGDRQNLKGFLGSEVCLVPGPKPLLLVLGIHSPKTDSSLNPTAKMYCCDPNNRPQTVNIYLEKRMLIENGYWKLREMLEVVNFAQRLCLVYYSPLNVLTDVMD